MYYRYRYNCYQDGVRFRTWTAASDGRLQLLLPLPESPLAPPRAANCSSAGGRRYHTSACHSAGRATARRGRSTGAEHRFAHKRGTGISGNSSDIYRAFDTPSGLVWVWPRGFFYGKPSTEMYLRRSTAAIILSPSVNLPPKLTERRDVNICT